ncbi:MAG: hypothetical protein LBH62_04395 [Nitrososphaerota archaeon]|nr:hypothetical protein [Nitrososphaerota archaeon]
MEEIVAHIIQPYDYTQLILTIVAISIAIASIWYAKKSFDIQKEFNIKSFEMQKEFNTKSVQPLIDVTITTEINNSKSYLKSQICNNGLGPAIIESIAFEVNKKVFSSIEEVLKSNEDTKRIKLSEVHKIANKSPIVPGSDIVLFSLDNVDGKNIDILNEVQQMDKLLNNMIIIVKHKDLYDNINEFIKNISE